VVQIAQETVDLLENFAVVVVGWVALLFDVEIGGIH
jgi:hypothetical protein